MDVKTLGALPRLLPTAADLEKAAGSGAPTPAGTSFGENWMQVRGSGPKQYQVDDFDSAGLLTYEDLFKRWETVLRFELAGQDSD